MTSLCALCTAEIPHTGSPGRPRVYCDAICREASGRLRGVSRPDYVIAHQDHANANQGRSVFYASARDAEADPRTADHWSDLASAYAEVARLLVKPIPYTIGAAQLIPDDAVLASVSA
ncbi:hypothetical protein FRAHR75_90044 [Frankia sp. Hr75.2]|nr:hypothetical protein FRAHR75_90044 [Frankia sp. Hr75.2]